jgi:SPP1 family phage portal protein
VNRNSTRSLDVYRQQNIYDLDSDIENDCAMFGQAFETVYVDEDSQVLSAKLSVYNTVVIYDDTFKHEKLMAIYYAPITDAQGRAKTAQYDVTLWDATHITQYKLVGKILTEIEQSEHYFGEVPVIHYLNNKRMKGDYETVISLIDAYNILQSDRVIDREKLVDAILAFYGAKLTEDDRQAIKENRVIGLPEGAKAEYLIKSINESDTDVLRETIAADIHKFSMTPDLTDETFGNAPSGVSILYKLLAFEQNIKKKERQFETALKNRFRLYMTMLSRQSKFSEQLSVADIDVVFSRALPKNDFETSQMINNLDGSVSQETLVGQLSFVNDASDEVKKAAAEKQERMQEANFATSTFPNVDGGNDE